MILNYEGIKQLASQTGLRVTDLLGMSPTNDPFYAGTPRDVEMAEWFYYQVWVPAGYSDGAHLRRAHYWAVSRENIRMPRAITQGKGPGTRGVTTDRYLNTLEAWKYLTQAAKMARYLGYIRLDQIVDRKNPDPVINAIYRQGAPDWNLIVDEVGEPWLNVGVQTWRDLMPAMLEVWVEKTTMNDVLEPICRQFGANLVTFAGEASITAVNDLAVRIEQADKPTRIFYISDFDPAGNSMSKAVARKLEWILYDRDMTRADVKLRSLVMTPDQVREYNLPRTPIKPSERRAAAFEDSFGEGGVELDALEAIYPGELAGIVRAALVPYYDREARERARALEEEARRRVMERVSEITAPYQEQIEALKEMTRKLKGLSSDDVDVSDLQEDPSYLEVSEYDEDWLYDAERGYEEQIVYYKAHAGLESALGDYQEESDE